METENLEAAAIADEVSREWVEPAAALKSIRKTRKYIYLMVSNACHRKDGSNTTVHACVRVSKKTASKFIDNAYIVSKNVELSRFVLLYETKHSLFIGCCT